MVLSCEAVVAMLALRDAGRQFDVDRCIVARVGLTGAVELACSVERVGIALDDLILRWPGREK